MDSILNEESKKEPAAQARKEVPERPLPVRRRKPAKKRAFQLHVPEFLKHLGADVKWYYDIRLWSPLLLILFILALLPGKKAEPVTPVETVPAVTVVETQPMVAETQAAAETTVNPEAEALARLADSVGAGRSDNVKIAIMWVAINRSEDRANGYGQDLLTEIDRANQWQGYDPNLPYTQGTYEMALEVLDTKTRGRLRPIDADMLWLVLNDNGSVTLRNQFVASSSTNYHVKTVK